MGCAFSNGTYRPILYVSARLYLTCGRWQWNLVQRYKLCTCSWEYADTAVLRFLDVILVLKKTSHALKQLKVIVLWLWYTPISYAWPFRLLHPYNIARLTSHRPAYSGLFNSWHCNVIYEVTVPQWTTNAYATISYVADHDIRLQSHVTADYSIWCWACFGVPMYRLFVCFHQTL